MQLKYESYGLKVKWDGAHEIVSMFKKELPHLLPAFEKYQKLKIQEMSRTDEEKIQKISKLYKSERIEILKIIIQSINDNFSGDELETALKEIRKGK